jgi:myosin heavy subunit
MQMGKTKVFIRRTAFEALEYIRGKRLVDAAISIQSVARMFVQRTNYEITLYAVVLIQKFVRQIGAYRIMHERKIENAVAIIQKAMRCYKARRRLQAARWIACWCQSAFRGAIARQYCAYLFLDGKASSIQRAWKRFRATSNVRRILRAIVSLQNRHRSRKAVRELRRLRREARDLAAVAAERDKFKEESKRLRKELEEAKNSPEVKASANADRSDEIENLRLKVQKLQSELEEARRMSNPDESMDQGIQRLVQELVQREEELSIPPHEVAALRSRDDHSSTKSLTIDTTVRELSALGSHSAQGSPFIAAAASPGCSEASLLNGEIVDDPLSLQLM